MNTVREKGLAVRAGNVLTSDVFYNDDPTVNDRWRKMGVLAVEMEAAALYYLAAQHQVHAYNFRSFIQR